MEIVCGQLFQALEYERMLSEEGISGQRHLTYILEQPERRAQKMKRIYEIRDYVAEGDLRFHDKEKLLSKTNREIKMLRTGKYLGEHEDHNKPADFDENTDYMKPFLTHLLSFGIGVGSGYKLKEFKDDQEKKSEEKFKQQVSEAFESAYKELQQRNTMPGKLIDEITSEMKQINEAANGVGKILIKLCEKLDEREKKKEGA